MPQAFIEPSKRTAEIDCSCETDTKAKLSEELGEIPSKGESPVGSGYYEKQSGD
jgi:hypothetical protein